MNRDFRDLLSVFLEAGVRFLVVGAHAMAVHGVPRATGDLDVWIASDAGNVDRAWSVLLAFGAPLQAMGVGRADQRSGLRGGVALVRNKRASGRTKDLADLEALGETH